MIKKVLFLATIATFIVAQSPSSRFSAKYMDVKAKQKYIEDAIKFIQSQYNTLQEGYRFQKVSNFTENGDTTQFLMYFVKINDTNDQRIFLVTVDHSEQPAKVSVQEISQSNSQQSTINVQQDNQKQDKQDSKKEQKQQEKKYKKEEKQDEKEEKKKEKEEKKDQKEEKKKEQKEQKEEKKNQKKDDKKFKIKIADGEGEFKIHNIYEKNNKTEGYNITVRAPLSRCFNNFSEEVDLVEYYNVSGESIYKQTQQEGGFQHDPNSILTFDYFSFQRFEESENFYDQLQYESWLNFQKSNSGDIDSNLESEFEKVQYNGSTYDKFNIENNINFYDTVSINDSTINISDETNFTSFESGQDYENVVNYTSNIYLDKYLNSLQIGQNSDLEKIFKLKNNTYSKDKSSSRYLDKENKHLSYSSSNQQNKQIQYHNLYKSDSMNNYNYFNLMNNTFSAQGNKNTDQSLSSPLGLNQWGSGFDQYSMSINQFGLIYSNVKYGSQNIIDNSGREFFTFDSGKTFNIGKQNLEYNYWNSYNDYYNSNETNGSIYSDKYIYIFDSNGSIYGISNSEKLGQEQTNYSSKQINEDKYQQIQVNSSTGIEYKKDDSYEQSITLINQANTTNSTDNSTNSYNSTDQYNYTDSNDTNSQYPYWYNDTTYNTTDNATDYYNQTDSNDTNSYQPYWYNDTTDNYNYTDSNDTNTNSTYYWYNDSDDNYNYTDSNGTNSNYTYQYNDTSYNTTDNSTSYNTSSYNTTNQNTTTNSTSWNNTNSNTTYQNTSSNITYTYGNSTYLSINVSGLNNYERQQIESTFLQMKNLNQSSQFKNLSYSQANETYRLGRWYTLDAVKFQATDYNITQIADQAVDYEFNVKGFGFSFNQTKIAKKQYVGYGVNYNLQVQYQNETEYVQVYQVSIYQDHLDGTGQVVSVERVHNVTYSY